MTSSNLYDGLRSTPPEPLRPVRALAVGAHPDDIEFGAGATLARWADAGCHVVMAVVTDGSKGAWDPATDPERLARRRREEQRRAAVVIGAATVVHLDHVDGELEYSMALRAEMALLVRRHRPDVVLTHDPWQRYQMHPDHRVTGMAVNDGVVAARDPLFFPEQRLAAHRPGALLLWSADEPDHLEPVTAAFMERKAAALLCHTSQAETTMEGADGDAAAEARFRARLLARAEADGERLGGPAGEAFRRLTP